MPRFFLEPDAWTAEPVLGADEARHFTRVLRGRAGDAITVFDGCGRRAEAVVTQATRGLVCLRLGDVRRSPRPLPELCLGQAIPKGKTMDLIVQKAVELGAARIEPLLTRHTVVQPGEGKGDKWQRVALEACKQCGQDHLPRVAPVTNLAEWLRRGSEAPGPRLLASLAAGARPLRQLARAWPETPPSVTVLVGPEGDFAPEETAAAVAAGFEPVSLGPVVLRVETAALFCLSALRYEFAR
jgi:16S rRNA (uracil1498-N3)-methyltransferase